MPLKLILGPANSAKAGVVLDAYRAAARRGALLVVPSSADAVHYDRELTAAGTALGRALTFPRLIEVIARRGGYQQRKLTALQRQLVVARAHARYNFKAISESAGSSGFTAAAARLFAELRGAHIEPPRFAAAVRQWQASDYADDLAALYLAYARELERTGMVDEQQYAWGALDALRERPDRWEATPVYFYGFDDLSEVQLDAVRTLAEAAAAEVTVSLTFEQDREALRGRAEVAAELRAFAAEVQELPALDDHYLPASRVALHQLERGLFESGTRPLEPEGAVRLIEAGGALAEAEQVAADVITALRDGVAAEQIVVITRSLAASGQLLERTLRRYGVPVHSDRAVPVGHTRLGRAVVAWARLCLTQDPGSVPAAELIVFLRAAADGGQGLIDEFEAAVRRAGITAAAPALEHPAARGLRGGSLREMLGFISGHGSAGDPLTAVSGLVYALLARVAEEDAGSGRAAAAILDALREIGELKLPAGITGAELQAVLESLELVADDVPQSEAVLVAEPLQVRARRFRRVFVTGLCDGEFPGSLASSNPFLDDDQRFEIGQVAGLRLPRLEEPLQRERYLLYACVSRATEQVSFSYRTSDEEGKLELPSPFLEDVRALFTQTLDDERAKRPLSDVTWAPGQAPTEHELRLALAATTAETVAAGPDQETRTLSAGALEHVRHARVVSAGALVKFARCPVRWLVDNQLRPEGLDPEADPLARGSFMHTLLEQTLRALAAPLTDQNVETAIALLRRFAADGDHELAPGQSADVRAAVRDGVVATLERFLRETAPPTARWRAEYFETRFGVGDAPEGLPALQLGHDGDRVSVSGTIDRIDLDRANPNRAVVTDYKSGGSGADSRRGVRWIEDGEIQVALYMLAAERLLGLRPVAGLYQPLSGPDLSPRGTFDEAVDGLGHTVKTDAVDSEGLAERLDQAEALAVELGGRIKRGQLTPCPQTCSRDGCRYPWICWAQ